MSKFKKKTPNAMRYFKKLIKNIGKMKFKVVNSMIILHFIPLISELIPDIILNRLEKDYIFQYRLH